MPQAHAVDTSNNQGAAVVGIGPQLAALGVEGWWAKATQSDSFRDKYWPACRESRVRNGLRYGGPYHWLQPDHDAGSQFRWFEAYVGDLLPGECVQLDVEDPGGLPDQLVFDFLDLCEARWPGRVIVYTGRWYMRQGNTYLTDRLIARYGSALKWWLPWYSSTFPAGMPTTPVMWQWAGGQTGVPVDGVGRVDSNQIIDRARLELLCGYGDKVEPPPVHPQEDTEMQHLYYVDVRSDPQNPATHVGYGALVKNFDGTLRRRATDGEGVAAFAGPMGVASQADYEALGWYNPAEDGAILRAMLGGGEGLVSHTHDVGATGPAVPA